MVSLLSGTENESEIKVKGDIGFYFLHTFSEDAPLYKRKPLDNINQIPDYKYLFQFNDSFKQSIVKHLSKLNESGKLERLDTAGEMIVYELKSPKGLVVIIRPSHIIVLKKLHDAEPTKDEYQKIYRDLRSFIYENFSSSTFCFDAPPDFYGRFYERRFCPILKQNKDYQRDSWTILIEFNELTPSINESNKDYFKGFHQFDFPLEVKEVGPLFNNNYLFYGLREAESLIVSFNPKRSWNYLENYLILTELIFANAEQDKEEIKRGIKEVNKEIERYRDKIYLENNDRILEEIKRNLSVIDIDNLTKTEKLSGLAALEKLEGKLIRSTKSEKKEEIYPLLYEEKIKSHYDSLSDDLEQLQREYEDVKSEYADVSRFADSRLQFVRQLKENRWGIYIAIFVAVVSIIMAVIEIRRHGSESKQQMKKMEELIKLIESSSRKIVDKLDELRKSTGK